MKPNEIKKVLEEIGGGLNKKLGQHFLIDTSTLNAIVEAADIKKGDRVLEVGPGFGVLTKVLLEKGANVIAIEQDERFIELHDDIEIVQGDAAEMDWDKIVGGKKWKFVSNLPYSITSLALRKALWAKNPPEKVVVLIQKEVADRILVLSSQCSVLSSQCSVLSSQCSVRSQLNRRGSLLSLMVALSSSSVRRVKKVARGAFFPPPKVESAVLEIVPILWKEREEKWGIHPDEIMKVAKQGFLHPRKMLASNLGIEKSVLEELGLKGGARAENLNPEDWAKLTKRIA